MLFRENVSVLILFEVEINECNSDVMFSIMFAIFISHSTLDSSQYNNVHIIRAI